MEISEKNMEFEKKEEIRKKAYEVALGNLRFESSSYWKRVNYCWLLQAAVYAGYFYCLTTQNNEFLSENPDIMLGIACLGFLTALAWILLNIGSRQWHKIWIEHLREIEKDATGQLYNNPKNNKITFSVIKVNELVSRFSVIAWLLLGFKTVNIFYNDSKCAYAIYILIICVISLLFFLYCKDEPFHNNKREY